MIGYDMLNEPWNNAATLNLFMRRAGAIARRKCIRRRCCSSNPSCRSRGPLLPVGFPACGRRRSATWCWRRITGSELFSLKASWRQPGAGARPLGQGRRLEHPPCCSGEFGVSGGEERHCPTSPRSIAGSTAATFPAPSGATRRAERTEEGWLERRGPQASSTTAWLRSAVFSPRPILAERRQTGGLHAAQRSASATWHNDPALGGGMGPSSTCRLIYAGGKAWKVAPAWAAVSAPRRAAIRQSASRIIVGW